MLTCAAPSSTTLPVLLRSRLLSTFTPSCAAARAMYLLSSTSNICNLSRDIGGAAGLLAGCPVQVATHVTCSAHEPGLRAPSQPVRSTCVADQPVMMGGQLALCVAAGPVPGAHHMTMHCGLQEHGKHCNKRQAALIL
jgi:hypothetical protein